MPFALEIHERLRPEPAQQRDLLLDAPPAIGEGFAHCLEFGPVPADADAEPEPAAAEHVDFGGLLGDQCRLPLRQDEDAVDEAELLRHAGKEAEQDEGLMEHRIMVVWPFPAGTACRINPDDMIEGENMRIAERFGRLCVVAHGNRVGADVELRKNHAKLHWRPPFFFGSFGPAGGLSLSEGRSGCRPGPRRLPW